MRGTGVASLSERQRQVAELVATGITHKETAARLGITPGTVKVYLSKADGIFAKLGVESSAELIRYWVDNVEMPQRGDCSTCCLRLAHLAGNPDLPIL